MTEDDASIRIKTKARDLGFDKVGITSAQPSAEAAGRLRAWLAKGFHAGMGWMERNAEKRADVRLLLSGARSVVSVAMNYYTAIPHPDDPSTGKISRYAWGDDYHLILSDRLEALLRWMTAEFPGSQGLVYVDTGPVMEKVWAQRAGIGWEGKHTNVITRDLGSWVFLGEVITTLELREDTPETDHCGTCTLCIDACPTGAIVEPYVVNSHLCLSYLTIEHRGSIEGDITEQFDRWIYGCDVCQDVCPWNTKFARETTTAGFEPREGNVAPRLESWERMTHEEFDLRFKGSPIRRARHEGLLRSIRIVEGVRGRPDPPDQEGASHKSTEHH